MANGSFVPDSTSSTARTRGRSRRPRALIRKNTAAASVDAMTAPISKASIQFRPRTSFATGAVRIAVMRTPTVARVTAGARTLRKVTKRVQAAVEQDEGQRDRTDRIGDTDVIELDTAGPVFAGQHADQEEDQQQGRAKAHRDQARQDAGEHQQAAQQNDEAYIVERTHRANLLLL